MPTVTPAGMRLICDLSISAALFLLVLVAYWGVWNYDFVYFDDPGYVSENLPVTRGLPLFSDPPASGPASSGPSPLSNRATGTHSLGCRTCSTCSFTG